MIDYVIIGKRIKELRCAKGMTQAALAELSGVEPSNISHIERAATKLSLPTLVAIANALGATLDEIVYNNFPWPTPTEQQKQKIGQTATIIRLTRCCMAHTPDTQVHTVNTIQMQHLIN